MFFLNARRWFQSGLRECVNIKCGTWDFIDSVESLARNPNHSSPFTSIAMS